MHLDKAKFEKAMKQNFFNNEKLAKACGVSVPTISRLRNGKTEPQAATLEKICKALNCSPSDIMPDE